MIDSGERNGYPAKAEIKRAFLDLLTEKLYMDITVSDIVRRAKIARTTFYRNFNSTKDVIDAIADDMFRNFSQYAMPVLNSDNERKWREFLFRFFYQFAGNYKKISNISMQNMSVFFLRINERMESAYKEYQNASVRDKYCIIGKMALISRIARKWGEDGMKETPEEMVDYIMSFITKF